MTLIFWYNENDNCIHIKVEDANYPDYMYMWIRTYGRELTCSKENLFNTMENIAMWAWYELNGEEIDFKFDF